MQAIAEQAGASTATIYRRWPNKAAVVMDAFLEFNESLVAFGEGRDIVSTIADQMRLLIIAFQGQMGETLRALVGEAQFDPELADALRERWLRPRRRAARAVLQHAVDRGELPDQDLELLLDTLYGHVYYRLLLRTSPLDPGAAEHVVTRVLLP